MCLYVNEMPALYDNYKRQYKLYKKMHLDILNNMQLFHCDTHCFYP